MAPQREGSGEPGIFVDPAGLDDFSTRVRGAVDSDIDPAATRIGQVFSSGSTFGQQNVSREVLRARLAYYQRLLQSSELMSWYTRQGEILAQACAEVARAYRDADRYAAGGMPHQVSIAFDNATKRVEEAEKALAEDEWRVSGGQRDAR